MSEDASLDAWVARDAVAVDAASPPEDGASVTPDAGEPDCLACSDGSPCTRDRCAADGTCSSVPDDTRCAARERCSLAYGCVPILCGRDQECDDGRWCTGAERCDHASPAADPVTGCVPGDPRECDDGFACTDDVCDDTIRACRAVPRHDACDDGVGCTRDACEATREADAAGCTHLPDDAICLERDWCSSISICDPISDCLAVADRSCNDDDPCTTDTCDGAARACVHTPWDADRDGAPATMFRGVACAGSDCDDTDPFAYPGAAEVCDGADDDCDGLVDEACDTPGDTCDVPTVLAPPAWPIEVSGSFARLARHRDISCLGFGRGGAADAFYAIDITEPSDVRIDVPAEASNFALAVTANPCLSGNFDDLCVQRWRADPAIQPPTFLLRGVRPNADGSARRVYIAVAESQPPTHRTFRFSVGVTPTTATDCAAPLDVPQETHVQGFVAASDSATYASSCATSVTGREHVYRVVADAPMLRAELEWSTFPGVLSIRSGACSGAVVGCERGVTTGSHRALLERSVSAGGAYVVVVDGAMSDADSYVLRIQ